MDAVHSLVYINKIDHVAMLTNPNPCTKVLHSLQGQLSGIQCFILFLNSAKLEQDFNSSESMLFHTIGPKFRRELTPLLTVLTLALVNVEPDLIEDFSF